MLDRLGRDATVAAYRTGAFLARTAPRPVAAGAAAAAGRAAARVAGDRRRIVERNLARVYGRPLEHRELSRRVSNTFQYYARYYYDAFRLPHMSAAAVEAGFEVTGLEHLEAAMADDPVGPVLALPHLGGWEWAGLWITRVKGWGLTAVVEPLDEGVYEWFLDLRRSLGMNIVPLGPDAMAEVAAAAQRRDVVCLLSDRDLTGGGVEVEFFGERTTLPAGPALLALRMGCRVLPTAVYFQPDDGCRGVLRPPLDTTRTPGAKLRHDVERITQALAHELEILIRDAPEQWHLMQPNWPSDRP